MSATQFRQAEDHLLQSEMSATQFRQAEGHLPQSEMSADHFRQVEEHLGQSDVLELAEQYLPIVGGTAHTVGSVGEPSSPVRGVTGGQSSACMAYIPGYNHCPVLIINLMTGLFWLGR